jgi:hypothetical protein
VEYSVTSAVQEVGRASRSAVRRLQLAGEDSQDEPRAHLQQRRAQFVARTHGRAE